MLWDEYIEYEDILDAYIYQDDYETGDGHEE